MVSGKKAAHLILGAGLLGAFGLLFFLAYDPTRLDARTLGDVARRLEDSRSDYLFGVPEGFQEVIETLQAEERVIIAYGSRRPKRLREALEEWRLIQKHGFFLGSAASPTGFHRRSAGTSLGEILETIRTRYLDLETGEWRPDILRMAGVDLEEMREEEPSDSDS